MSIWEEYYLSKYFNIFGKQPQEIQKKLYNDYITALNQYYTLVRPDLKGKIKSNITIKDLQKLGVEEVVIQTKMFNKRISEKLDKNLELQYNLVIKIERGCRETPTKGGLIMNTSCIVKIINKETGKENH